MSLQTDKVIMITLRGYLHLELPYSDVRIMQPLKMNTATPFQTRPFYINHFTQSVYPTNNNQPRQKLKKSKLK